MEKSRHTLSTEPPFCFWNYLVLGGWKAMAWLGPMRFGLYSLTTLTARIILYMAGTVVVLIYFGSIGFYAKKEQSMLCFSSL